MTRVVEINDAAALADQRLIWSKLLALTPRATFFQSLDWLLAFWRHYGETCSFRILIVYSADGPIGILPLYVRPQASRLGLVRTLTYPLRDWGTFYGPVGANPTATLLAALGHIRRTPRDWDVLDLRWVSADGDRGRTRRAMSLTGFEPLEGPTSQVALVDLSGSWDTYWASRTSRWRNNVRRSEKKLAEQGPIRYERHRPAGLAYGDGDPRWDLFDECLAIAAASWQGSSTSGNTLAHGEVLPFLRDAHEAAARAGTLDVNLLYAGARPVAFNYAYHFQGNLFGLRTGYDPAHGGAGAGSVLQARTIADSFTRGDQLYNLGADYLDCKRYWLTRIEESRSFTWFSPRSPRSQALKAKRQIAAWLHGGRQPAAASDR